MNTRTLMTKVDRRTRINFAAAMASGAASAVTMTLIRLTGRHLASDGEHLDDHASAAASAVGLAVGQLIHLFVPSEKESPPQ
jgi:hypothetical protein